MKAFPPKYSCWCLGGLLLHLIPSFICCQHLETPLANLNSGPSSHQLCMPTLLEAWVFACLGWMNAFVTAPHVPRPQCANVCLVKAVVAVETTTPSWACLGQSSRSVAISDAFARFIEVFTWWRHLRGTLVQRCYTHGLARIGLQSKFSSARVMLIFFSEKTT